jgi:DNA-binding response OmpR family regulator
LSFPSDLHHDQRGPGRTEPLIRDIYAAFLALLGHEADVTADGREGLACFDPLVHKLVITDFLMPGLPPPNC